MNKNNNIPEMRFPEFTGEWESKKLGEVAEITTGNKDTQNKVENGDYPFFVRSQTIERINTFAYDGEAILTSGDGVGVGKNYHYINGRFDFHQRVYCLYRFKYHIHGKFLFFYFSEKFNRRIMRMSAKNSVDSIRRDMVFDMPIFFSTLPEQQKIASFLTAIDDKLQALKKKKALIEQYKKSVMQVIFSQQVRFKDDNGEDYPVWEMKKLGDVATFSKGKGISKNEISEYGTKECIRYGELYTRYNEVISEVYSKTDVNVENLILSISNDVIIPASGETQIDIATASCVMKSGVALGGDLNIIRTPNNGVFLSYYLNNKKKLDIANLAQGSSVVHLYSSQLATLNIELPILPEQSKIANFLTAIDEKLKHCQAQIEQTDRYKKGLLQKMFC